MFFKHQFYSAKTTQKDTHKTRKLPFSQLETAKTNLLNQKHLKNKNMRKCYFFSKIVSGTLHKAENSEEGTLSNFLTSILVQNIQKKLKGDPLERIKNFRKMSHKAEKRAFPKKSHNFENNTQFFVNTNHCVKI